MTPQAKDILMIKNKIQDFNTEKTDAEIIDELLIKIETLEWNLSVCERDLERYEVYDQ